MFALLVTFLLIFFAASVFDVGAPHRERLCLRAVASWQEHYSWLPSLFNLIALAWVYLVAACRCQQAHGTG